MPADVGEAIVAYLQAGRPADALGRSVFVRVRQFIDYLEAHDEELITVESALSWRHSRAVRHAGTART